MICICKFFASRKYHDRQIINFRYCEKCVKDAQKKKMKQDHTLLFKKAFAKISEQEKELEKQIAGGKFDDPPPPPPPPPPPKAATPSAPKQAASTSSLHQSISAGNLNQTMAAALLLHQQQQKQKSQQQTSQASTSTQSTKTQVRGFYFYRSI